MMHSFEPHTPRERAGEGDKPVLRVSGLKVQAGKRTLLSGVETTISEGKVTAVIGPSGSGKSTFLSVLNRLADLIDGLQVSGSVYLHNQDVLNPKLDVLSLRRKVSMVFQRPTPFPTSIWQNLRLPFVEKQKATKPELQKEIQHQLERVALWPEVKSRLFEPATKLSGGQQQRLCIARSLIVKPEILLLDEPCSALDPVSSDQIEQLVGGLKNEVTVLMVTHNIAQAKRLADHLIVLSNERGHGEIVEQGPAAEIFSNPQHKVTQTYFQSESFQ